MLAGSLGRLLAWAMAFAGFAVVHYEGFAIVYWPGPRREVARHRGATGMQA
jgi:hypothetical protein